MRILSAVASGGLITIQMGDDMVKKIGRRSDAITLYQKRKTDARMGIKLPEGRPRQAVLFEEIAADALAYSREHKASYSGDRSTIGKLFPVFGKTPGG